MTVNTLSWGQVIDPFNQSQVTPQGYDLMVDEVFEYTTQGAVTVDSKFVSKYEPVELSRVKVHDKSEGNTFRETLAYRLQPGAYLVEFHEQVSIPTNCMGIMHPRSSLLRCGVTLETAVWDAGYSGVSKTLMVVHNPRGFLLERFAPIGHMTLHQLDRSVGAYSGSYQNEGKHGG